MSVVTPSDVAAVGETPPRRGPFRPVRLAPVRERLSGALLRRLFRTVDSVVATAGALIGAGLGGEAALAYQAAGSVAPLGVGLLVTLAALDGLDAYGFSAREPLWLQLGRAWSATAAGALVAVLLALVLPAGRPGEAARPPRCARRWRWASRTGGPGCACAAGAPRAG